MNFREIPEKEVEKREFLEFLDYANEYIESNSVKTIGIEIRSNHNDFPIIEIDIKKHEVRKEYKIRLLYEDYEEYITVTISGLIPFFNIRIPTTSVVDVKVFSSIDPISPKIHYLGFRIFIPNTKINYSIRVNTIESY